MSLMGNSSEKPTVIVQKLLAERLGMNEFLGAIHEFRLGVAPSKGQWLASVGAGAQLTASNLQWLTRLEENWVKRAACDHITRSLTECWTSEMALTNWSEIEPALLPFLKWLTGQQESRVLRFCWDVLAFWFRRHDLPGADRAVHWLRLSGRLSADISCDNIRLGVALADEAKGMYWWPDRRWESVWWERDSQPYMSFLADSSYVVRGAAAKVFGELFYGCSRTKEKTQPPSISQVMKWVQLKEQQTAGVAGPFLHGARWPEQLLELAPEYDFRTWFLDTLRASSREPEVPHLLKLEFFATEYFCNDAAAIEELLNMGRHRLAVAAATEEPGHIEMLRDVLDAMSRSEHRGVANAIRTYLRERTPRAGLHLVSE